MSEIENIAPPAMPAEYMTDAHARVQYEERLREHFAGRTSDPHGNVAQFNQDMRNAGMQRADAPPTGEVDQTAMRFLTEWRQRNPNATSRELAIWEEDVSSILEGRRMGETPAQFAARKASAAPAGSPAAPAAEDEPKFVTAADVPSEVLHGYALPTLPSGVMVDPASLDAPLSAARQAGISQEQVARVLQTLAAQAAQ